MPNCAHLMRHIGAPVTQYPPPRGGVPQHHSDRGRPSTRMPRLERWPTGRSYPVIARGCARRHDPVARAQVTALASASQAQGRAGWAVAAPSQRPWARTSRPMATCRSMSLPGRRPVSHARRQRRSLSCRKRQADRPGKPTRRSAGTPNGHWAITSVRTSDDARSRRSRMGNRTSSPCAPRHIAATEVRDPYLDEVPWPTGREGWIPAAARPSNEAVAVSTEQPHMGWRGG